MFLLGKKFTLMLLCALKELRQLLWSSAWFSPIAMECRMRTTLQIQTPKFRCMCVLTRTLGLQTSLTDNGILIWSAWSFGVGWSHHKAEATKK